jgi:hypothetical protein
MELREWLLKRQIVIRPINLGLDNLNLDPQTSGDVSREPLFFLCTCAPF